MTDLADPTDPERMHLDSGAVPRARPLMFGDVFTDVPCSRGGAPGSLVMVMTHPCSMRKGVVLKDRVVTANVEAAPYQKPKAEKWATNYFDYVPLFGLPGVPDVQAVVLSELHSANSTDLDPGRRVLALSNYGVTVVLQRWIYQLSRDPVSLSDLDDLIAPILAEVEVEEDWCEAALSVDEARDGSPHGLDQTIREAQERVQQVLGPPKSGGLRDLLHNPATRADARRTIARMRVEEVGR